MTKKQFFGTDGIRGAVGEGSITPEFMLKLGWAAGKVFAKAGKTRILIGKDTRISGYMFESALEAGLSAAGVDSLLLGPMPTPAVAYLTRTFHANAGIVISASHNPHYDNGIKFFSSEGMKLGDDIELAIEAEMVNPMRIMPSERLGKAVRINDAGGRYVEFCKGTARNLNLSGLKIVLDCAHGATYDVGPKVFQEMGAEVVVIGNQPDGLNINFERGSTEPKQLQQTVLSEKADLGIGFDGDGDRVVMVDDTGALVDGDELLFIIAQHRKQYDNFQGGVVGTLMTNLGMEKALDRLDIPLVRAKVGDRYVMEQLAANNWSLGGEGSGHLVIRDLTTTGDAIVAALQVLRALIETGNTLHVLKQGMTKYPQKMINVRLTKSGNLMDTPEVREAVQAAEVKLADTGRVLLRPSGTEPLIRVMVEGEDIRLVTEVCQTLADVVQKLAS